MYVLVVVIGVGAGLLLRPVIQNSGLFSTPEPTPNVRCAGAEGTELALAETLSSSFSGQTQTVSRTYRLERPGLLPLQFDGGGNDADNLALVCSNVAFGPGARVSFARGGEVQVVELVGPSVKRFVLANDKAFSSFALATKFKLALKLEDYVPRGAPNIEEAGKNGWLELKRKQANPDLPEVLRFTTINGGATWVFVQKN